MADESRILARPARLLHAATIALAVFPLAACFQSSTVIRVKPDGSGTIEQRTLLSAAAIDQLRAFTILGGGKAADVDPVSEAQARSLAAAIGPGVTYVSSMPITTADAQGREAVYAFTDVSQLRISEQPQMPGGVTVRAPGIGADAPSITFALSRQPNDDMLLRIRIPPPTLVPASQGTGAGANGAAGDAGGGGTAAGAAAQQIEMAKQLLAGARLTVALEPDGRLVRTSSPYVEGNRVILVDVDVDQATKDPALAAKVQAATTLEQAKAALAGIPGLKLNLDPEITIEFTPAR